MTEETEDTATLLRMATSIPAPQSYTPADKYRDFRQLFIGTEQGQRVLREMLAWGHLFTAPFVGTPIDPLQLAMNEGERNIARKLLATVTIEPRERPARANTNPNKDQA